MPSLPVIERSHQEQVQTLAAVQRALIPLIAEEVSEVEITCAVGHLTAAVESTIAAGYQRVYQESKV